jgi:cytochrome c biogenesis protein CcmG/thiol:disulfide interchange protein DsbE
VTHPRSAVVTCVALLVLGAVAACTGDDSDPDPTTAPTPAIVVADAVSLPSTVDELPVIDAEGLDRLTDQVRGTPLVVNFWASWCEPCEREMPLLAAAAREHRDAIQFVGIDILDDREAAQGFLARFEIPYPNLFDASGETRDAVGSLGQPVTVFYGADGTVVAKVDGELSETELTEHLRALL